MISPEELKAWEKLCEKATAGPWCQHPAFCPVYVGEKNICIVDHDTCNENHENNREFIAVSRTAMPRLIARVRELSRHLKIALNARDGEMEENERLQAVVAAARRATGSDSTKFKKELHDALEALKKETRG